MTADDLDKQIEQALSDLKRSLQTAHRERHKLEALREEFSQQCTRTEGAESTARQLKYRFKQLIAQRYNIDPADLT